MKFGILMNVTSGKIVETFQAATDLLLVRIAEATLAVTYSR
jgi:hypothetical protein